MTYSAFLVTTSDQDLPPPDFAPSLTWERLTDTLRRLGQAEAGLLSEPVSDRERNQTDWRVDADRDPIPLVMLSPVERGAVLEKLAVIRRRVEDYANGLERGGGEQNVQAGQGTPCSGRGSG